MTAQTATWRLLAYDVRDPARLRRLHYRLKKQVAFVQESVALIRLDDEGVEALLSSLGEWIAPCDDLRIYRLTSLDAIWLAGPDPLPGMQLGQAPCPVSLRNKKRKAA